MRWIFATAAAVAIIGVGLLTFDALPTEAAVFSVGPAENGLTNNKCMDVSGNSLTPGTPVQVYDCHAGPNQQFQWASPPAVPGAQIPQGLIIYALSGQRCLTVAADGIRIESQGNCEQTPIPRREFNYDNGQIKNVNGSCLDAGDMANGTQLELASCDNTAPSQQWQIKDGAVFSVGPPNGSIGNFTCMEVAGNDLGTLVDMVPSDCHAGPSEQFQFAGRTIYAESGHRCLQLDLATAITPLTGIAESAECAPGIAQQFSYSEGQIINSVVPATPLCLEANTGQTLVFNPCESGNDGQQWQIK